MSDDRVRRVLRERPFKCESCHSAYRSRAAYEKHKCTPEQNQRKLHGQSDYVSSMPPHERNASSGKTTGTPSQSRDSSHMSNVSGGMTSGTLPQSRDSPHMSNVSDGMISDTPPQSRDSSHKSNVSDGMTSDTPPQSLDSPHMSNVSGGMTSDTPPQSLDSPHKSNVSNGMTSDTPPQSLDSPHKSNVSDGMTSDTPPQSLDSPHKSNVSDGMTSSTRPQSRDSTHKDTRGSRIFYDRSFLLQLRNSPLVKSPLPNMDVIPGVTSPADKPVRKENKVADPKPNRENFPMTTTDLSLKYSCCDMHGTVKKAKTVTPAGALRMMSLPFYETVDDIVTAEPLTGWCGNFFNGTLNFRFSPEQRETIRTSRGDKIPVQVLLRFCANDSKTEQPDNFNPVGILYVNNKYVPLQSTIDFDKKKKTPEPIDITDQCSLFIDNVITVKWPETKDKANGYCAFVTMVKKVSSETLLEKLMSESVVHPMHTRNFIKDKLKKDADSDIATTSMRASLTCPIGKTRLVTPCRGFSCQHIQCVDALTILKMNERRTRWACQVCEQPAQYEELCIDGLFLEVLHMVPESVNEIEFKEDGSWQATKEDNVIDLDVSMLSMSLDVIDLTETDDEQTPMKRRPLGINNALMNKATVSAVITNPKIQERQSSTSSTSSCRSDSNTSIQSNSDTSIQSHSDSSQSNNSGPFIIPTMGSINSAYQLGSHGCDRHRSRRNWNSRPYERSSDKNSNNSSRTNYPSNSSSYRGNSSSNHSNSSSNHSNSSSYRSNSSSYRSHSSSYYQGRPISSYNSNDRNFVSDNQWRANYVQYTLANYWTPTVQFTSTWN